ncbi:MAG: hypothetical protein LBT90_04235 [Holosporaceae bacterium]|jgi:hypothetical protein|nr:hypothetical protein [Holosporaceae bacterium]
MKKLSFLSLFVIFIFFSASGNERKNSCLPFTEAKCHSEESQSDSEKLRSDSEESLFDLRCQRKCEGQSKRKRLQKKRDKYLKKRQRQLERNKKPQEPTPTPSVDSTYEDIIVCTYSYCSHSDGNSTTVDDILPLHRAPKLHGMALIMYILAEEIKTYQMPRSKKDKNTFIIGLFCERIITLRDTTPISEQINAILPDTFIYDTLSMPVLGAYEFSIYIVKSLLADILNTFEESKKKLRSLLGVQMKKNYRSKICNTIRAIDRAKDKIRKVIYGAKFRGGYVDLTEILRIIFGPTKFIQ